MIEVEIKLPISDKAELTQKLQQLGFMTGHLVQETDIYFNGKHYDLRKQDMALRLRCRRNLTNGETRSFVTYKGPKLDSVSMTRKELETEIADADVCQEILQSLGFEVLHEVKKKRQYYHMGVDKKVTMFRGAPDIQVSACVDQVEMLGDFLELELVVEKEEERQAALQQIEQLLERMGYSWKDTTRKSYLAMLL